MKHSALLLATLASLHGVQPTAAQVAELASLDRASAPRNLEDGVFEATVPTLSSAFPSPPPFYKHFTSANLVALKQHQKLGTPREELPDELQYLLPPDLPESGYRCFGEIWRVRNDRTCALASQHTG